MKTTAGCLGFVSPARPEGKRTVVAVLAVGDLAWPDAQGSGLQISGARGLIFEIDLRTARVSSFGGARSILAKLGPGRRLN